ncbi:beta-N-acetylhexosaminidase [Gammaproteobacteria bacterium]
MFPGTVMLDVAGLTLTEEDRTILKHPQVGGVILFSRNYQSVEQLRSLVAEVHTIRNPSLLVAVDQEGGRVQRFREGFTRLPAAARFGKIYDNDPDRGKYLAELAGYIMAAELRSVGVDFSFAPVLDLGRSMSTVIGDRAFHATPNGVIELAHAFILGMRRGGMPAVGKHFPGHGAVAADSHIDMPVDTRSFEEISKTDLQPFQMLSKDLMGMMPAHVVYSEVDALPAGFSRFWLQDILRKKIGFLGTIFSDDLSMVGAERAGDYAARARAALSAGCDVLLVCNQRGGAKKTLQSLS